MAEDVDADVSGGDDGGDSPNVGFQLGADTSAPNDEPAPDQGTDADAGDDAKGDQGDADEGGKEDEDEGRVSLEDDGDEDSDSDADDDGKGRTVKVEGYGEVKISDLIKGYASQQENTRKSMDNATERKSLEAQKEQLASKFKEFTDKAEKLDKWLDSIMPKMPDPSLLDSNPTAYHKQVAVYNQAKESLAEALAIVKDAKGVVDDANSQSAEANAKEQDEKLGNLYAKLRNPETLKAFKAQNVATAVNHFGFTKEDAESVTDARVHELLYFAGLGKESQGKGNTQKSSGKPRTGTARKTKTSTGKTSTASAAVNRVKKTGSINDAAAALVALNQ